MSTELQPFVEYEVPGVGTVIDPEGEPGYRVRLPDGQVTAFPAASGTPSEANAVSDISAAIATPDIPGFVAMAKVAVQAMLDQRAQLDGYDGILSACSYAGPPETAFSAQGNTYLIWRSNVWQACYAALAAHQPSDPLPTIADFIAALPAYVAP